MKIVTFRIPTKITRDSMGEVLCEMDESKKEFVSEEKVPVEEENNIAGVAQRIGAENDKARALLKKTLLSTEKESNVMLLVKILS